MGQLPRHPYEPDYAVPPGATLEEVIAELGITQKELALRLRLSEKHVSQIINGRAPITEDTAIGLERVTGVPFSFWLNREAIYRERLVRIQEKKQPTADDLKWLGTVPVDELVKRGLIRETHDKADLLRSALAFFGVRNTEAWEDYWNDRKVAARRSASFKTHRVALATWLRLGELAAQQVQCNDFDASAFRKWVTTIRGLTTSTPDEFVPRTTRVCADAGVAFVLIPEVKKVPWHGASWWMTPTKAVIELNLRGKSEDQFWFSFFHEAGHILKGHSKKEVFINEDNNDDPKECEANEFALQALIPKERLNEIPLLPSMQSMIKFAEEIGISPGIVAGQYLRLTKKYHYGWVHKLIRHFVWSD